ncbi:nucleoside triphosphate pyrophosphohydrolase [Bacillus sp. T33-2]|uniref:nucleoside triphosphate pyrophosphohydrolase n=1 Tax=Bacillus sp. T33-2 TaxID=2054168 RepID=UPI000C75B83F|nr:nucleoside triphosphate pyrophosphohydrolase [Bacillus sp. T33-2]PLR91901.1 nucleoside triphosphate pyrophosphohydrolase [Bacillus sp. T33-2]
MMKEIVIIGLGAGDLDQMPLGVYKMITKEANVYLRTKEHPVIEELHAQGFVFNSFDYIYEKHSQFEQVYEEISESLLSLADAGRIVYAVPGHPLVAERTVQLLLEKGPARNISIRLAGGQSFLDGMFQALRIDPIDGFQLLDGTSMPKHGIQFSSHTIIGQVYDQFVASEVKLNLMEKLPDEYEVTIVTAAGSKEEKIKTVPLFELDREIGINNLTSVYVPPVKEEKILYREFSKLREIIAALRGPDGCPWDKKQTHLSLKKYLVEEAYELIDAINHDDIDNIIEELGDVLLQVMLHAQIGEDEGFFVIEDVIEGISSKMVRRHPHVFGAVQVQDEEDVLRNWQEIKNQEKGQESASLLKGVGKGLPSLLKAYKLQKEAAKVGFDWEDIAPIWDKVMEEIDEFSHEMNDAGEFSNLQLEYGDLLFALVNVARHFEIDPEEALFQANEKFIRRFAFVEKMVQESGTDFDGHSLEQLDSYWDEAKKRGL